MKRYCSLVACIAAPNSIHSKSSCCNAPTSEEDFAECIDKHATCFTLLSRYRRYLSPSFSFFYSQAIDEIGAHTWPSEGLPTTLEKKTAQGRTLLDVFKSKIDLSFEVEFRLEGVSNLQL